MWAGLPPDVRAYILWLRRGMMARERLAALRVRTGRRAGTLSSASLSSPRVWQASQHILLDVACDAAQGAVRASVYFDFLFDTSRGSRLWYVTLQETVLDERGRVSSTLRTRMTRDGGQSVLHVAGLDVDAFARPLWGAAHNHVWELLATWARRVHFVRVGADARHAVVLRYDAEDALRALHPARAIRR